MKSQLLCGGCLRLRKSTVSLREVSVIGRGEDDLLVPTGDGVREPQNRRTVNVLGDPGQESQVGIGVFQDQSSYCKALSD